jgi:hypothetical protein
VAKNHRLALAPIFVVNLRAVFHFQGSHRSSPPAIF